MRAMIMRRKIPFRMRLVYPLVMCDFRQSDAFSGLNSLNILWANKLNFECQELQWIDQRAKHFHLFHPRLRTDMKFAALQLSKFNQPIQPNPNSILKVIQGYACDSYSFGADSFARLPDYNLKSANHRHGFCMVQCIYTALFIHSFISLVLIPFGENHY